MGYPRIEKPHRLVCVCLFSPLKHASSMAKYLKRGTSQLLLYFTVNTVAFFTKWSLTFDHPYYTHLQLDCPPHVPYPVLSPLVAVK